MSDDPLSRFWAWLAFVPEPSESDPPPKRWHVAKGDEVEIRVRGESLGRYSVLAASSKAFKISDGRVFHQRGYPLFSGRRARVRAVKVRR